MTGLIRATLCALLACVALADDAPKKACSSTLKGDYQFEACGAFCKEAKKGNHCKFCKCKSCSFCAGTSSAAAPPALMQPLRGGRSPPPPRWPKNRKKGGMGGNGYSPAATAVGGSGKEKCQSGLKGDLPFMMCASFCKSAKATNHCKFCKCRNCQYCSKDGKAIEGGEAAGAQPAAAAAGAAGAAGAAAAANEGGAVSAGVPQRGVPIDRVASTGASHARVFQGVGVAILIVLVGLGLVAFTSAGDAMKGTWRHELQKHLAKMGLASHGVEGNRLTRDMDDTSDLDAAFRKVDELEVSVGGRKPTAASRPLRSS